MENSQYNDLFDAMIDLHKIWFNQIKLEWGTSTVSLKKYLKTYYNQDIKYAHMSEDHKININYILPYRKVKATGKFNGFYGQPARERLKLAILAKAYIMQELGNTNLGDFGYECLRLYTLVNSCYDKDDTTILQMLISFENFSEGCMAAWDKALNERESTKKLLEKVCNKYKPKREQKIYHYTLKDFELVKYEPTYEAAYNKWKIECFPFILDKFKERELIRFKADLCKEAEGDADKFKWLMNTNYKDFKASLDKIQIREINDVNSFRQIIHRLKKKEALKNQQ